MAEVQLSATPAEIPENPRAAEGTPSARDVESPNGAGREPLPVDVGIQNVGFVEELYAHYLQDSQSVPVEWQRLFMEPAPGNHARWLGTLPRFEPNHLFRAARSREPVESALLQERVDQLVRAYRVRGHIVARLDPLERRKQRPPELDPLFHGLTPDTYDLPFSTETIHGPDVRTLREILQRLENTYCRSIGAQFMHIDELTVRQWLLDQMEYSENRITLQRDEQVRILTWLTDAVVFEEFLQKKYLGTKSFSLEGAESLIPLLALAIERAGDDGVEEIVLGMAHRGRLNVLANILGKSARDIFREFEDIDPELHIGRGDVKYHLGHSHDWKTRRGGLVHLSLCFNPSHLEFVGPVALGRIRAKQDRFRDPGHRRGMALLIHGDAAFAGEGVVQEMLNLSELAAYATGGSVHVIVNNQLGFTTPPEEARSSTYASDVAKMLQIPIFHVNGEDPEAVAQVVRLALDFRKAFQRDVVIDMYCYRLRGHNEGDEPAFTQPLMYRAIQQQRPVRERYLDHLLELGEVTREAADGMAARTREHLEQELAIARSRQYARAADVPVGIWSGYVGGPQTDAPQVDTRIARSRLSELLAIQTRIPADFHPHPKIERWLKNRVEMAGGERPLDWSAAEALAIASLAADGVRIRMTGQDTPRGTFSQRHAALHDMHNGQIYMPLQHIAPDQGPVEIWNSPLSEAGVLGFEYGYSLDCPEGLVLWEAQYGDFTNAAQVIIDQFLVSAEEKWRRLSGLVLLLPHGLEGQGPEHSSARLERFLELAACDNIQVGNLTTPAQYLHCLRRQALRPWRKPLVLMTPKSLLRHPRATSSLDECAATRFQCVIGDRTVPPEQVRRVLLCSGKIFYELEDRREQLKNQNVAIIRLEQLYPLPLLDLSAALAAFGPGTPLFWVQEEPENMGAWRFLWAQSGSELFGRTPLLLISRPARGSPATGSGTSHKREQEQLLAAAFSGV